MTFKEVLHEVVSWIEKDQRVSYSAIKRQFDEVDDEYLEDLKDAILYAYQIELEERGFRWKIAEIEDSASDELASNYADGYRKGEKAERRRITVMFCDLADSTRLSQDLDPEDLREVIRAYQSAAATVIHKYDGYIAQYLGDGLLVYFGWPKAHENDAERAVLTSLEIVQSIGTILNPHLRKQANIELTVRLGIHTGLVVVGEMGGDGRFESLATGDTVNIASRLENLADPNSIIISEATHKLVADEFDFESLGARSLKGVIKDTIVYKVLEKKHQVDMSMADEIKERPFLVWRDEEIGLLNRRWEQAKRSLGQIVLICGAAGIGKSGLVDSIRADVHNASYRCIVIRCSSYHQNSAYYPLINAFERAVNIEQSDSKENKLHKLEQYLHSIGLHMENTFPYLCKLLSIPPGKNYDYYKSIAPQKQKQLTSDAIVSWLFKLAQQYPLLAIWEDLHWADPSTLEVVGYVVDQIPTVPMLAVYTYRPYFVPMWRQHSHITPITLSRLELVQVKALISHWSDRSALPIEVVNHIVDKTDGVPLFIEEMTKMLLESDILRLDGDKYELSGSLDSLAIPDTLQDSLMARLDKLNTAKEIAQLGSVIGREFSYESIETIHTGSKKSLDSGLEELLSTELLYARGRIPNSIYTFKHALVQDAAYNTLLRSSRQKIHLAIAQFIESKRKTIGHNQPELIAHHYTEGLDYVKALEYWLKAGNFAMQNSSHSEAIAHVQRGLQIVDKPLDASTKVDYELNLQLALGPSLIATKGFAFDGVGEAYQRARTLALKAGDTERMHAALWGLCSYYITSAQHEEAKQVGADMSKLPTKENEGFDIVTNIGLGVSIYSLSSFEESMRHFDIGIPTYKKVHHDLHVRLFSMDMGVFSRSFGSHSAWQSGHIDISLTWSNEALEIAEEVSHPFSRAVSRAYAAMLYQFRLDVSTAQELAASTIALSTEQHFAYYLAWGMIIHGWCVGVGGNPLEGQKQIEDGLVMFRATGAKRALPYYLSLLADTQAKSGHVDQAIATIDGAIKEAISINERWWLSELYREKGDYLQLVSPLKVDDAISLYQTALDICKKQGALTQSLRAATHLAKLYSNQNQQQQAIDLLKPVLNAFNEGRNTNDLIVAKELLDSLAIS
jgi:class 3 adenylate cyclase